MSGFDEIIRFTHLNLILPATESGFELEFLVLACSSTLTLPSCLVIFSSGVVLLVIFSICVEDQCLHIQSIYIKYGCRIHR